MLSLDSTAWEQLTHAYGPATDIPALLQQLYNFPPEDEYTDEPWFSLWSALCHQGDVYSASFAAVPFIVHAAEQNPAKVSHSFFLLPAAIEVARVENGIPIPEHLQHDYFNALSRLPALGIPLARPGCDETLCTALLAAIAAASGQHAHAKLLLDVDSDCIEEVLEWFHNR